MTWRGVLPETYLYLVDIETEDVLAIRSLDDVARELDVMTIEARFRAEHNVDDVSSGLAIRDSRLRPLPPGWRGSVQRK